MATLAPVPSFHFLGEPLSAPNAHELRPSELCSSRMIERRFPLPLSAPAFSRKTLTGFAPTLQRFDPTREAVPLSRNPTFYVESGTVTLLGFTTSQALCPETLPVKHLPSRLSPLALPYPKTLRSPGTDSLRVSLPPARYFPPKRAPACLMFRANCHPPPL